MLAAQGKSPTIEELLRSRRGRSQAKSLALLTVCLVSLFAFASAIAASTHGQWQGQNAHSLDTSQYLNLFRQQQEPLVVVDDKDDDDDDSSGRLAYSPPQLAGQQQQAHDTYYATLPLVDEARRVQAQQLLVADQVRREKLGQQLQLARQLLVERMSPRQQLAVEVAREQVASPLAGRLQFDEAQRALLERDQLLNRLASKLRLAGSQGDGADADDQRLEVDDDDDDDQQQLTSAYSSKPLAAPLVSSQEPDDSQAAVDRLLFGQNINNEEQQALGEPKSEYFYDVQQEDKRQGPRGQLAEEPAKKTAGISSSSGSEHSRAGKFTTLLEDEQTSAPKANETSGTTTSSSSSGSPKASGEEDDDDRVATTTQRQANETTHKLVPTKENVNDEAKSSWSSSSVGSMFGQMLHKISSYLPFLGQLDALNNPKGGQAASGNKTSPSKQTVAPTGSSLSPKSKDGADAKQSVSDTATTPIKDVDRRPSNDDDGPDGDADSATSKAKLATSKISTGQVEEKEAKDVMSKDSSGEENNFSSLGTFDNIKPRTETNKKANNVDARAHLENSKRVYVEGNRRMDLDISGQYSPQQQANVNYLRSSNLVLPIGSNDDDDELHVRHQTKLPPSDGIVSKYIYAPTHHYYLTPNSKLLTPAAFAASQSNNVDPTSGGDSSSSSAAAAASGFQRFFAAEQPHMSHRSFQAQHQFMPGEQIFSSYDSLKPAYAFQKNGLEGIALVNGSSNGNKSNDIYFLVMVGAFCVMAMAVVLAAGLFAYRVQQNRKSSQDTDYPTYGVVGPNNMDGKCGAAAFMGGYLGGASGGPGSSGSFGGSKSGSAKHLADMYASDSGLASTDKGSSKKASLASASSATTPQDNHPSNQGQHHHQQQQANSRTSTATAANNLANNQDAARMYHYQHQKQQMIISDRGAAGGRHTSASDLDSEDENEDGSYTVYECPGLASAHEMEIKNPLFNDDQSP